MGKQKKELIKKIETANSSSRKAILDNMLENGVSVYPDIIVHHRGTRDNLLVIEVKKNSNPDGVEGDRQKLAEYKNIEGLAYRHAFMAKFPVKNELDDSLDLEIFVEAI